MCRLLGISYGEHREELDTGEIAAILFPALVRQGPHAYGWMTYNEDPELTFPIHYEKFPGRCDTKEAWENILENVDPGAKWFVGHTRWATHGDPEDNRNNHPIPHGDIIGVHNGTVSNYRMILSATGREDPKTKVDSEAIFAAVNKWGPTKGLSRVDANMVAIYANRTKPHVLHMARSYGRQITLGWTERGNLIFASDKEALLKLQPEIVFKKFSQMTENRLLLIKNGRIIQRFNFGKKRPMYVPPASITVKKGGLTVPSSPYPIDYAQVVASRRGQSILFPDGPPAAKHAKRLPELPSAPPRRAHNQNQKVYYYQGVFMTHDEYMEALAENEPHRLDDMN